MVRVSVSPPAKLVMPAPPLAAPVVKAKSPAEGEKSALRILKETLSPSLPASPARRLMLKTKDAAVPPGLPSACEEAEVRLTE